MKQKPGHKIGESGRLAFRLVFASFYLLSALGGPLHFVLYHAVVNGHFPCAVYAGGELHSDCDGDERHSAEKNCPICATMARSIGTCAVAVAVSIPALAGQPDSPLAVPDATTPFRPHTQRGPPVQV